MSLETAAADAPTPGAAGPPDAPPRRLRVLTWHVHGNYLYYLSHAPHEFYLATLPGHPSGHAGRVGRLPWGQNVHEVPADALADHEFDCVLYQHRRHWDEDRHQRLTPRQRALPSIFLEHDPPRESPTDTRHPAAGAASQIVHVTAFNELMWDNGETPSQVIEHGVSLPANVRYSGERPAGIVVINQLAQRGRRLGRDLFESARRQVPLTLVGMQSQALGGRGEVGNMDLPATVAQYRFFFHPVRYTSLGLALIEAMMLGSPVVALATTEIPTVIRNGVNGFADTRPQRLVEVMRMLIDDPAVARQWGDAARRTALARFSIERFAADWDRLLQRVAGDRP